MAQLACGLSASSSRVFEAGQADGLAVVALNAEALLVCYTQVAGAFSGVCKIVTRSASQLSTGIPALIGTHAMRYIAVARLSSTQAVACFKNIGRDTGECAGISHASATNSPRITSPVTFTSTVSDVSVASFGAGVSAICFRDDANLGHGTCKLMSSSENLSVQSQTFIFSRASTRNIVVTSVGPNAGIVCYRDSDNADVATCAALSLVSSNASSATPNSLSFGMAKVVHHTEYADYLTLAAFDSSWAIVCYGRGCMCSAMSLGSSLLPGASSVPQLSIGTALVVSHHISSRFSYKSVNILDAFRAIVCFNDDSAAAANTCSTVTRSGGALFLSETLIVSACWRRT